MTQFFQVEPNPANPANWSNERLREWVTRRSKGRIDPDKLCPFESGMQAGLMFRLMHSVWFIRDTVDILILSHFVL